MTIKRLNFWLGRVIGTAQGERIWDGVEGSQERLLEALYGAQAQLLDPPELELSGVDLEVSEWSGWSLNNPTYQEGAPVSVPVDEATHGFPTGPTSVTASSGLFRHVMVLARYVEVGFGSATDADGQPVFQETHHGVQYRVIMSEEFDPLTSDGVPPSLFQELVDGSIPLALIREDDSGGRTLWSHLGACSLVDNLDEVLRLQRLLRKPGTFLAKLEDDVTFEALPLELEEDGGSWYAKVVATTYAWAGWWADRILNSDVVKLIDRAQLATGTSLVRLKLVVRPPACHLELYTALVPDYPSAAGEAFDSVPTSLVGDASGANFPSTSRDIALALVEYDGVNPPTMTRLHNPPEWRDTFNLDYEDGSSALNSPFSLGVPELARELALEASMSPPEDSAFAYPANRGVPHLMNARLTFANFQEAEAEVEGRWLDTSSGLAVPGGSPLGFVPESKLTLRALDPRTQLVNVTPAAADSFNLILGTAQSFSVDAVSGASITLPLNGSIPYEQYAILVQTQTVYWRTGGGSLVGTDVNTPSDPGTDDPNVAPAGALQALSVAPIGTDTKLAFRTNSGTATVVIFAVAP